MKTRSNVYPWKQGSRSAKELSLALGSKVLKHENSKYRPRPGDVVINWGSSNVPDFRPAAVLNPNVQTAQCKLASLTVLNLYDVNVPPFWTNRDNIQDDDFPVVCRTKLNGHSGDGIVIANTSEELVEAPLYVKYIKKKHEYRVHVFHDTAFFVQRKARKLEVENPDWKIRNLAGGFVFAECDLLDVPEDVIEQARLAIEALGLDFGGVDVIFNEYERKAYVLEVNTACGLEARTAARYAEQIRRHFPAN